MGKTVFFENSSMIDNEFLEHRLKLIPINCDYIDSISKDYENIVISCKKQNENNENYADDHGGSHGLRCYGL